MLHRRSGSTVGRRTARCWSAAHPGAAAVIPAVVHARRAFGLQFFPRYQPRRLSTASRTPLHWTVNSGSAERGNSFASATSILPAVQSEHQHQEVPLTWIPVLLRIRRCTEGRAMDSSSRGSPIVVARLLKAPASLPRRVSAPFPNLFVPKLR